MLNDPTLLDPSVTNRPPVVVSDDSGLIAGRYRLLRPLGEGGMGNVYLAEDRVLARQVAVKTVRAELSGNEEVRARIKRECRLHAAIGAHPNIITLYDTVEENGHIYLVMEYFAGETLADRLAATTGSQGLPLHRALDIVRQILQALACIHSRDIVHRDIKTANILLQEQPDGGYLAKLTDFGIARAEIEPDAMTRLTSLGVQGPGTPVYMAPERIDPQIFGDVCPASDLYAVGIILFELLAGQPPFTGTMTEIFSGHLVQQPALTVLPPHLPERLHAVLRTALAKQPADRYQDADRFLAVLAEFDANETVLPEHTAVPEATLLALPDETPLPSLPEATVLHPALGRSRDHRRMPWRRPWVYAAVAVLAVLAGSLWYRHTSAPVQSAMDSPDNAAGAVTVPPAPAVPADQVRPKDGSALETVENVRQQKKSESMAAARTESGPVNGWQVTEDRTRRLH